MEEVKASNNKRQMYILTDEVYDKIVEAASYLPTENSIAKAVGISKQVLYSWTRKAREYFETLEEGQEPDLTRKHIALYLDMHKRRSEVIIDSVKRIRSTEEWRGHAWLLSKLSEDFSDNSFEIKELKEKFDVVMENQRLIMARLSLSISKPIEDASILIDAIDKDAHQCAI